MSTAEPVAGTPVPVPAAGRLFPVGSSDSTPAGASWANASRTFSVRDSPSRSRTSEASRSPVRSVSAKRPDPPWPLSTAGSHSPSGARNSSRTASAAGRVLPRKVSSGRKATSLPLRLVSVSRNGFGSPPAVKEPGTASRPR